MNRSSNESLQRTSDALQRSNAKKRAADSVAYARGFRGEVQVGDDTVCEFIDAAALEPLQDGDTLVVTLAERKLKLSLLRGR